MYKLKEVGSVHFIDKNTRRVVMDIDSASIYGEVNHNTKEVLVNINSPEFREWTSLGFNEEEARALVKLSEIESSVNLIPYEDLLEALDKVNTK